MEMYKVGDEVLVKSKVVNVSDDNDVRIQIEGWGSCWFRNDSVIPAGKTYADGLSDAWELAKKILEMCGKKREEILGLGSYANILEFVAAEEALAKIEAFEKEKEIKVGDVVVQKDTQKKFLVVTEEDDNSVYEFGVIDLETLMLDRICNDTKIFQKTGKHIDIESLLRQIGE